MERHYSLLLLVGMLFLSLKSVAEDVTIQVVTEDAYPLQYLEQDQLIGPAFDIVSQVLTRANLPFDVNVLPWARAYASAKSQPNTLIFSIARTPSRESEFHWIGALMELEYFFYGLAENFPDDNYHASQFKDKRIGTILDSATYQFLQAEGFKGLYPVSSPKQNYNKLLNKRIDVIPANAVSFQISCKKFGKDCHQIKQLAPLGLPAIELYFALSKSTSPEVVERIEQAYQELLTEQVISTITLAAEVTIAP